MVLVGVGVMPARDHERIELDSGCREFVEKTW
jgi:hypothetical protein